MKKLLFALLSFTIIAFTSCFNMDEEINIADNGSGSYSVQIDMSEMMGMVKMMGMMDTSNSESSNLLGQGDVDSIIYMKNYADTVTNITPKERVLMKAATMHIVSKEDDQVLKFTMNIPFKNMDDFQQIVSMMTENGGMGSMMGMMKGLGGSEMNGMGGSDKMPDIQSIYTFSSGSNFLEKKVDEEKLEDLKNNPQWSQMEMSAGMMGNYKISTVIHLPDAAKKVTGSKAKLSEDKKTVTISSSMSELFSKPESLAYRIEF